MVQDGGDVDGAVEKTATFIILTKPALNGIFSRWPAKNMVCLYRCKEDFFSIGA